MQTLKTVPNFRHLEDSHSKLKAILWDMDGTICNTESVHALALYNILESDEDKGKHTVKQLETYGVGLTDTAVFNSLKKKGCLKSISLKDFLKQKNEQFNNALDTIQNETIFNSQILDIFDMAQKQKLKLAVVTSSEKETTHKLLSKLNLIKYFDLIITQEDTKKNKPSPDPYLLAMKKLNVNSSDVIIFEDSKPGLEAAEKAGAHYYKANWY